MVATAKSKTATMDDSTKKTNALTLKRALKSLPNMPSSSGRFGDKPPKKRLKDFFGTVLNVDAKPGPGFTMCQTCFKYVAIRRYHCQNCNSKNPSSRNPNNGRPGSKRGSASKDEYLSSKEM